MRVPCDAHSSGLRRGPGLRALCRLPFPRDSLARQQRPLTSSMVGFRVTCR